MQLYLLLNEICNLNCSFCIRGNMPGNKQLDIDNLYNVLNKNDFRKYNLLLTGGEPTLHKQICDIILYCKDRFKSISINTNGIETAWLDNLSYKHIHIQISLDGTKDVHNYLRANGKEDVFSKVLQTIEKIENMDISYNISSTICKSNKENIEALSEYLLKFKKMKYWKVSPQLPFGCGNSADMIETKEWNKLVDDLIENSHVRLRIKKYFDFDLLEDCIQNNYLKHLHPKINCGDVRHKLYVYPDFTVYPCTCLTDFPLGNLLTESLFNIITNAKSDKFVNYKVLENSACYKCKYLSYCNGGCIGMSYNQLGKLGKGDIRCPFVKRYENRIS